MGNAALVCISFISAIMDEWILYDGASPDKMNVFSEPATLIDLSSEFLRYYVLLYLVCDYILVCILWIPIILVYHLFIKNQTAGEPANS